MNFYHFFLLLWVFFALLDPDPDPDSEYGSGSTDPIEYGSNTDPDPVPDPDPQPWDQGQAAEVCEVDGGLECMDEYSCKVLFL